MNATKRKFNALLNGIGNKPSNSLSPSSREDVTMPGETETQKRRRILETSQKQASSSSKITPAARSSAAIRHKKSASLATGQEPPKYAPWDREEFLKRLQSFSNITDWTPKPDEVNEVEWAKRGWVCQKSERVRCCLCNVEILVKLNQKVVDGKDEPVYIAQNIEDALVDKYVELIVTSHEEQCLWRKRGCDDSIFKLSLGHLPTTLLRLTERYDELCVRSDTLPYEVNLRMPTEFKVDTALSYLPSDFFNPSPEAGTTLISSRRVINRAAFIMAFFGWQGHKHSRLGDQVGSVSCQACFRTLGLWLFKSKEVSESGEVVVGAAVNCLNVLEEHREYCPWHNAASQNGQQSMAKPTNGALAGWETLLRGLKSDHHMRTSGQKQPANVKEAQISQVESTETLDVEKEDDNDDAASIREENDKKRWARLRRVKSLFDTKGTKKTGQEGTTKSKTVAPS